MGYVFEELCDAGYSLFKERYQQAGETDSAVRERWTDARRGRRRRGEIKGYPPETYYMSKEERITFLAAAVAAAKPTVGEVIAREASKLTDEYDPKNDRRFLEGAVRTIEQDLRLQREKRLLAEYQRKEAQRNLFLDGVRESVRHIAFAPQRYVPETVLYDAPTRAAAGLWSDLHAGKATSHYNETLARQRVAQVVDATLAAVAKERTESELADYHMLLLGDLCDGAMIYPSQTWHSDQNVLNQIFRTAAPILAEAIRDLAPHFRNLHIHCVPGNHGRGQKGMHEEDNADNYLYETVRLMTEQIPGVTWHMNHHWFAMADVLGTNVLMVHGHQMKANFSVPFYSLTRKALGWHTSMSQDFQVEVCGHFHQPNWINCNDLNLIMNGAFVGDDDYALENLAAACGPAQTLLFFEEGKGLTGHHVFRLD